MCGLSCGFNTSSELQWSQFHWEEAVPALGPWLGNADQDWDRQRGPWEHWDPKGRIPSLLRGWKGLPTPLHHPKNTPAPRPCHCGVSQGCSSFCPGHFPSGALRAGVAPPRAGMKLGSGRSEHTKRGDCNKGAFREDRSP